uniref:Methionyl-tRNA formyltransferase n=1 Tax=uncultured Mycoplasmataceae bacterium TaxID=300027 RepID=A0A6G9HH45_9MOLU|nr:methionyl-tRNA formyltransferase [uncultured Mycoplasmataceae bacterium]
MCNKSIVFIGTPQIAADCLQALIDVNANIVAVVTRSDKPSGRNNKIIYSPVKELALKNNLKLFQPEHLSDIYEELKWMNIDLIFTCAYGKIIPNSILELPRYKSVNVHPSLLPKYRGASPIQSALINGENKTGVSFIYVTDKLDAGDILFQEEITIDASDNYLSLYDKLSQLSVKMIKNNFDKLFNPSNVIKQNDTKATFCKIISHEDEKIDWTKDALSINNLLRGLYDKPAAFTTYENLNVKIYKSEVVEQTTTSPGKIVKIDKQGILVETGKNCLLLKEIQLPGKKRMQVSQLINGNHIFKTLSFFK